VCSVGISFSTGVLVKYLSLRCLIQADSGAHPSYTSICTDCSFSYVIKFPLNFKIPKLVLSSDSPQGLLVQVCKQCHFLCAAPLWMMLWVTEWGAPEICCFRNADKFLRRFLIVTALKTVSFVFIALWECHILHSCWVVCVYSEFVSILLRWVLELFTFCERLGSEYQAGNGGHFFWELRSRMSLGA
jgi:hypothetical protein